MAAEIGTRNANDLYVLPFTAQGHISPALAFSKYLASKGLKITILTSTLLTKSAKVSLSSSSISIQTISDGSEDVQNQNETLNEYFQRSRRCLSQNLARFLEQQKESGCVARAIVYDSCFPWVLDIARGRGLLAASLFTQSCSVCAVYYHFMRQGLSKFSDVDYHRLVCMSGLEMEDLPLFPKTMDPDNTLMNLVVDQFSNLEQVDWVFFNSFDKLENEVIEWMSSRWPIKTIGPTMSLVQTNEDISDQKIIDNHMISIFEQTDEEACTKWLDSKETNSILYVSFGSVVKLEKEQMEEIAFGLMMSNCNFLWVVRWSEENKLPHDFISNAQDRGLVVKWCSQPRILAHPAVSCFMTHCGWNSFLEALSCGVPIIGMAQWGDQQTNAKFIEDVWKVGVRVRVGDIKREEIVKLVAEVVHGDKGKELKRNACKWKELVEEAVGKGGTSAKNADEFVWHILGS